MEDVHTLSVIAGSFTFNAALEFVVRRARALRPDPNRPAGMAAVAASSNVVMNFVRNLFLDDRLTISVHNSEESVVVSGSLDAIERLVSQVKGAGLKATKLDVNQGECVWYSYCARSETCCHSAFHSPYVAASLPELQEWLADRDGLSNPLKIPIFSSALGRRMGKGAYLETSYWVGEPFPLIPYPC